MLELCLWSITCVKIELAGCKWGKGVCPKGAGLALNPTSYSPNSILTQVKDQKLSSHEPEQTRL